MLSFALLGAARPDDCEACRSFYLYANHAWIAGHPAATEQASLDRFDLAVQNYRHQVGVLLERAARARAPVGDFYASCMDTPAIERDGARVLAPELARIEGVVGASSLAAELARLHDRGIDALFTFGPSLDPLAPGRLVAEISPPRLDDRDLRLADDALPQSLPARAYRAYARRLFALIGDSPALAASEAAAALSVQRWIVRDAMASTLEDTDPRREHAPLHVSAMKRSPIDWPAYFAGRSPARFATVNDAAPGYVTRLEASLAHTPFTVLRSYLRWSVAAGRANDLSARFVWARNTFVSSPERPHQTPARWAFCVDRTAELLPDDVAALSLSDPHTRALEARASTIVEAVRTAMRERVRHAAWLSPATRKRVDAKIASVSIVHGAPAAADTRGLAFDRAAFASNVESIAQQERRHAVALIGAQPPRRALDVSPVSSDVHYTPALNQITLTPPLLQAPFLSGSGNRAEDFGAFGALIGHEFMHAIDEYGRQFDETGEVRPWWSAAEVAAYHARTACVTAQFQRERIDGVAVRGQLVRDEAVADLGGVEIAYGAYAAAQHGRPLDGRAFFLAFARMHAASVGTQAAMLALYTDEHPPERLRVDVTLRGVPAFAAAFRCAAPAGRRCGFW